ncbi:MAG TPA: LysR family transcriptional regulator [Pseudolabrys sp.]|nr:LysR family transcriptional regulator [Pseudolabrys sp.]
MLDRFTSMSVFVRVAALGSLSAAARALGLSPTMVTKHIAALESRLGVKLFHRSTRRLSLTEAGRNYLESAERILADVETAESAVAAERIEPRGLLRINVPVSFGSRHIAPLLNEFLHGHPHVTIELGLNDRLVDLAEEGWDLAIRIGHLAESSLIARRLAPCTTALAASPRYLKSRGTPKTIADLKQHNCLSYTLWRTGGTGRWRFGRNGEIAVEVDGTIRANNGDALCAAAVAGEGIVYEPTFNLADDLRAGTLVKVTLDQPTVELDGIYAVYLPNRNPPAKLRVFIDFLAERFAHAPWDRSLR